jgi:type I restriction enzyme R subunit
MARKKAPEITFQDHIAAYLVREHRYGVLEQPEITDTEHAIVEDHLWAFLKATQKEALDKLAADYGTDARDEVFKALRSELRHTPLWMLLRQGLQVRGLEFRLFSPSPGPVKAWPKRFLVKTASLFVRISPSVTPTRKSILSSFSTACP